MFWPNLESMGTGVFRCGEVLIGTATLLMVTSVAFAQEAELLRGTWTATGQQQLLRGTWTATIRTKTADAAQGSWVLLDQANKVVLQGMWAAEKSSRGWQGTWSARVVTRGRAAASRPYAGTWQARVGDPDTRTFADMLRRTLEDRISGTWRSAGREGTWSLTGSPK